MDVARSTSQGTNYHADVIYMLRLLGIKMGARALWYTALGLHQLLLSTFTQFRLI